MSLVSYHTTVSHWNSFPYVRFKWGPPCVAPSTSITAGTSLFEEWRRTFNSSFKNLYYEYCQLFMVFAAVRTDGTTMSSPSATRLTSLCYGHQRCPFSLLPPHIHYGGVMSKSHCISLIGDLFVHFIHIQWLILYAKQLVLLSLYL